MTPELHRRASELFLKICDLSPDERCLALNRECGGDSALRQAVESLLVADPGEASKLALAVQGDTLSAQGLGFAAAKDERDSLLDSDLGPYRIVKQLGEGGMGVVYLADQSKPIHRRVALKVIKLGMDTKQIIARFETKREALAMMNHPNVARVFDAGATQQGRPYFAMEYVAGIPITEYCDKNRLPTEQRLRLFMDVCHAVQHAHQKGIIHRDIKPSNVLVTLQDDRAVVKVIDFGVAKATQHRLTERSVFTEQGQLIGTPGYMSPEQAEMTALDIDTRTDVYSLGVLLYELLVGQRPFDDKVLREAGLVEIQRVIREVDPPKPSTRLSALGSTQRVSSEPRPGGSGPVAPADQSAERKRHDSIDDIAHRRHTEPKTLIRQIRGDLDWIVMRAMEKDRTRRYETANALSMEVARFLDNEPVLAGPPSAVYRFRKFARRNRAPLGVAALVFVVLLGAAVFSTRQYLTADAARRGEAEAREDAEKDRDAAETARDEAEQVTQFLSDMLASVRPEEKGKDVSVRQVLDEAGKTLGQKLSNQPLLEARLRNTIGASYLRLGLYDEAEHQLLDAATTYRRILGERDRLTLACLSNLGTAMQARGGYTTGEALLRSTLEIQRRVLGEEHPDTLASMQNLAGTIFFQRNNYAEAEELTRKALGIRRRVQGEEHPDTLELMCNLGVVLYRQRKYTEAESLYRQTLEIQRRVRGEDQADTLMTMHNLANLLTNEGKCADGENLGRQTVEGRHRVLGEEHPDTLQSMHNLANAFACQGRFEEAEVLSRQTLDIRRRVLGEQNSQTLAGTENLADFLYAQGKYEEVERLYRSTLESLRHILGEEHQETVGYMNRLAESLVRQSKLEEARLLVSELIALHHKRVEGTTSSPEALNELAWLLLTCEPEDLRDPKSALVYAEKAVEATGGKNPMFLDTLALGYYQGRKIDRAVETQRKALALLPADRTPVRIAMEGRLGEFLTEQKDFVEAELLLIEGYEALSDDPGLPPRDRKEMLERLVKLYDSWDAAEPGKGYAEKAAEWRAKLDELNAETQKPEAPN